MKQKKQKSGQIDFNDEQHLKSLLKQAKNLIPNKRASLMQRAIASFASNPRSLIPIVIVLLYFALCGVGLNVAWIVNLILWLIKLF